MIVLLSPAKNLDFSPPLVETPLTSHAFVEETATLAAKARTLSRKKLRDMMGLSPKLAELNHDRFQSFDAAPDAPGRKAAILAFKGDTYIGLDANSLSREDLDFAQEHVRILSGLYGLLKPYDGIHPYRLEMGTKIATRKGKSLYDFWGTSIADALNEQESDIIVNCASNEYFAAVKPGHLKARVITPVFKDIKDGKARQLFMFVKQARGMMARYIIQNRITRPEQLREFNLGGYTFVPELSDDDVLEFHRQQPPPKNR